MTESNNIIDIIKDIWIYDVFNDKCDLVEDISSRLNIADGYSKIIYEYLYSFNIDTYRCDSAVRLYISLAHNPKLKIEVWCIKGKKNNVVRITYNKSIINVEKERGVDIYAVDREDRHDTRAADVDMDPAEIIDIDNPEYKKYDMLVNYFMSIYL